VGVKLTGPQQPEQVLVSAELHQLSLQMPSSFKASLVVQQVLVQARNADGDGSSSGSSMVPVLQVPASDMQAYAIQSCTRFGSAGQQQQQQQGQQQAGGLGGSHAEAAATSPRPSSVGRIYHESPLSSYISHIQVRGAQSVHTDGSVTVRACSHVCCRVSVMACGGSGLLAASALSLAGAASCRAVLSAGLCCVTQAQLGQVLLRLTRESSSMALDYGKAVQAAAQAAGPTASVTVLTPIKQVCMFV
jgi:hypothetical protein